MSITIQQQPDGLHIQLTGWDRIWSVRGTVDIPATAITGVYVGRVGSLKLDLGWRTAGTYMPGLISAGRYAVRDRKGLRQFWCVHRAKDVLVIETSDPSLWRVVLEVDDPQRIVDSLAHGSAAG